MFKKEQVISRLKNTGLVAVYITVDRRGRDLIIK